jgi:uroporphyrinogen-III synthase
MEKILKDIKILLTRTKNQSVEAISKLESIGAEVISFPTIQILPIQHKPQLDEELKKINEYNTLIFTSENAVRSLTFKIEKLGINFDPEAFFVISIGERTTKVCRELGFRVDLQSNIATSGDLIKELGYIDLVGRKILIPSSSLSNPKQFESLEDQGATISPLAVYENKVNDRNNLVNEIQLLENTEIDLYIFTSPSTFKGFLDILEISEPKNYFEGKKIAVIGPVTEKAIIAYGIQPQIIPPVFSMNNLIEEIAKYYSDNKKLNSESIKN